MKTLKSTALASFLALATVGMASAQETQVRVVDEVVAQVNNNVITLSSVRRETKNAVDSLVQEGKKREDAQKLVDEKQGELIANLINEQLLVDRAKDLGLESEIEGLVNQRLAEIMKQIGAKTVEAVYAEMQKSGVNPNDVKENWRRQIIRDQVLQRDLQAKIYWGLSGKELKDYYEAHKDKFTKPESISFSELFLGFAGRDEKSVRDKALQLYNQLKAGGDWAKIVKENGDTGAVTGTAGSVEHARISDLNAVVLEQIKNLKAGEMTYPFELRDLGMVILKVDSREQASNESVFNENAVRMAILNERLPDEQKKYMAKLRKDGYVSINDNYRPIVSPVFSADEPAETPKATKKEEKSEKSKSSDASAPKTVSEKDKPNN